VAFFFLFLYVAILLIRPQEWYVELYGLQLVNIAAILTIIATPVSANLNTAFTILKRYRYAHLMWALLAAVVLSQLTRLRLRGAYEAFSDFGKVCVLFFLTIILVDRPSRVRKMLWLMLACAAFLTIHAHLQITTGIGFGRIRPFGSFYTEDFRIQGSGMFNDPNDFAMMFVVALGVIFCLFRTTGNPFSKILMVAMVPALFYVLYHTRSRSGVVGIASTVTAYVWMATGRSKLMRIMVSGIMVSAIVAFGPARARGTVYEGSAGGRVALWGQGNQFLKENPLFGIGYTRWEEFAEQTAHNSFVLCYGELGLVGYAAWFSLIWLVMRNLAKVGRMSDLLNIRDVRLASGLFSVLAGYMASAFFLSRTYNPLLFFLLSLGIAMIHYAQMQPQVPPERLQITKKDLWLSVLMSFISVPIIWIMVRTYWSMGGRSE
jgi:O-antigen ligase